MHILSTHNPCFMKYFLAAFCLCMSVAVFAQNTDSAAHNPTAPKKDTMNKAKPGRCRIMLAGRLGVAGDSTSVDDILADPIIRPAKGTTFSVTAFEMAVNYKGEFHLLEAKNDHLTKDMLKIVKDAMQGTPIIIQNVHYALPDGKTGVMPGLVLCINK
jgi:hypothetical protein